jgi:photosystem II stability/assembly factor-like uncharacterized protein
MYILKKVIVATSVVAALGVGYQLSSDNPADKFISNEGLANAFERELSKKSRKAYDKPQEANDFALEKRLPQGASGIDYSRYREAIRQVDLMPQYSSALQQVLPNRAALRANPSLAAEAGLDDVTGGNEELGLWENLGPGNIGGRTRSLVINPEDENIIYTAGVAGGVWKSDDAGENWSVLDDMLPNLAVTTLVMDPNDPDTLYAGTGEGFFNGDAVQGDGVFVTTDAGETWEPVSFTAGNVNFNFVNKLAFSPNDSNTLYAATREGIFRTQDAGDSWVLVHDGSDVAVGCTDISVRNDLETDTIVAACGSFLPGRIVHSIDGGDTFEVVLQEAAMGRSTIAIAPSDQNIIYVLNATNQFTTNNVGSLGLNAVFRSDDGGATWATQYSVDEDTALAGTFTVPVNPDDIGFSILNNPLFMVLPACGIGFQNTAFSQGWYDNIIQVDPINPDVVWTAGIDIFRSTDAGESWGLTSAWFLPTDDPQYAHADNHILTFPPGYDGVDNQSLYVGNDGGVQRVANAGSGRALTTLEYCGIALENGFGVVPEDFGVDTFVAEEDNLVWENLNNGLQITQYYNGAAFPDGETYFGGTQDNGTLLGTDTAGTDDWIEILGGDGGYVAVDPTNPDILFAENTGLSIQRSNDGGQSFAGVTNGITGGGFPFITAFIMDSNNPQRLWILGSAIWRTDDQADNWVQASTNLGDAGVEGRSVAHAPTNSNRVIVGTDNGFIFRNADAGNADATTVWESSEDLGGFISSVAFDPQDENIAYATSSTFGQNHIFRSTDAGATWTPIDNLGLPNGIPDIPVHSIVVDPADSRRLFVGTDLGVFVSIDTGANWMVENGGFANTPTETLEFEGRNLFAFTHGRSAYRVSLNDLLRVSDSEEITAEDTALEISGDGFADSLDGANVFEAEFIEFVSFSNGTLTSDGESVSAGDILPIDALGELMFTPSQDFNGDAAIEWQARNDIQVVTRGTATVSVEVTPVNDAPVAQQIPDTEGQTDTEITVNVAGSFSDVDGDALTFSATGLSEGLTISPAGVITGDPIGGSVLAVTVTASDGEATASSTFNLSIPSSGGSLNINLLIALMILIGLRRRKYN